MPTLEPIKMPRSPYWGGNVHVGFTPSGKKKFSKLSTKIRADEPDSKDDARAVLVELQSQANKLMQSKSEIVYRDQYEQMVDSLITACGKTLEDKSPKWSDYSPDATTRICRDLADSTAGAYKGGLKSFTESLRGDPHLTEISVSMVQSWYDAHIEAGGSPKTANKKLAPVRLVFREAVLDGLIRENPCERIRKQAKLSQPYIPFTMDQLSAIHRTLADRADEIEYADEWVVAVTFATFTGAREGDCLDLNREMINEDGTVISFVEGKKQKRHGQEKLDGSIKMMLHPVLQRLFEKAATDEGGYFCPNLRKLRAGGSHGVGQRFKAILDLAKIEIVYRDGLHKTPRTCFHSFRAMVKTELNADGVRQEVNDHLTGHKDKEVGKGYISEKVNTTYRECESTFERFAEIIS